MFNTKKTTLFEVPAKQIVSVPINVMGKTVGLSSFTRAGLKKSAETLSGNGALKYSTTGNSFVDQFGKISSYKKPRSFAEIEKDCETLWAVDKMNAVKFMLYLRTITRKVQLVDGAVTEEAQKGGELRHEPIMRMLWLAQKSPDTFWKNIGWFIALGSWHDMFTMLQYDLVYNGWDNRVLDWTKFANIIMVGLTNSNTSELLKKYLPQIKSRSNCTTVESQANTMIGKWICSLVFGNKESSANYKAYRKLKTSGTAHQWQQLISQKQFSRIEFDKIHGRALNLLVRSKFLKNQGLSDKFSAWVKAPETKVKYTGFVHELFANLPYSLSGVEGHVQATINKQFDTLVEKGKTDGVSSLIVVRDTSGSMGYHATGSNMSCFNVAKALALYFSSFLSGKFANSYIEFNRTAKMHTWTGNNALERWYNDNVSCVGNTNFQTVINLFASIKAEGVPESEFPTGILCLSDGEFDPASLGKTNVDAAKATLRAAGFSQEYVDNFIIVLWNLTSNAYGRGTGEKFETHGAVPNVFYFGGYSAAVVSFLLKQKILNAEELFGVAMDQEILNKVEL